MGSSNEELLEFIAELEDKGYSEEQIDIEVNKRLAKESLDVEVKAKPKKQELIVNFDDMPDFDPYNTIPPKPDFFTNNTEKFKHRFFLKPKGKYTLNDQERMIKKMNLNDTMRLISKVPMWAQYLAYKTPDMLVNEFTGEYKITETLLKLFERAFSDYDHELKRPTDFSLSVLEEVVELMNHPKERDPIDVEYLLSCDGEEVLDAVEQVIECNKGFFLKLASKLSPLKKMYSLISGQNSQGIEVMNNLLSQLNTGMKQSQKRT